MKLLIKAESLIQRDAIVARLHSEGIACIAPERTISRKIMDGTVDLTLGGYSTTFDGFSIFVEDSDFERAGQIVAAFLQETTAAESSSALTEGNPWRSFFRWVLLSLILPVLPFFIALHYLRKGMQSDLPVSRLYVVLSVFLLVINTCIFIGAAIYGIWP